MSSVKCPECHLTNWAAAITCKRCGNFLQAVEENSAAPHQPPGEVFSGQTSAADLNPEFDQDADSSAEHPAQSVISAQTEYSPHASQEPNLQEPDFQSQKTNQSGYSHRSRQQSDRRYNTPVNLKSGLAIASMILGITGFLGSIFLVGILFAPIGLILGIIALIKANKNPQEYGGKGFAVAGIATGGIVVLFVPIIMAIAIPNLLASMRAADEASAIQAIKTISTAEARYMASAYGKCGDLQTLIATKLLDVSYAENEKHGYRFMVINLPAGGCEILATPISRSWGNRSFYYSTEDGTIRGGAKKGLPANKTDFPIKTDLTVKKDPAVKYDPAGNNDLPEPQKPLANSKPNEAVAISTLRTLQTAETSYSASVGQGEGADLQNLLLQGLINQSLADGEEGGYRFKVVKFPKGWEIFASPVVTPTTNRSFYIGQEGVIRGAAKNGAPADKTDPPINF